MPNVSFEGGKPPYRKKKEGKEVKEMEGGAGAS